MALGTRTEAALADALHSVACRYTDSDRESALFNFIDGLATAYAGYRRPEVDKLLQSSVVDVAAGHAAWLVGHPYLRSRPSDAVLINAMAAHLDDFDDDETAISIAHVTVPTMTATLAAASFVDVSGKVVLDSYLSGVETMLALGELLNPEHYQLGWHASATLGVFGAAMAAAHVLGLSKDQKATALAFAVTSSSGTRSAFGSSAKPWQVAASARDGLNAALLARAGLDSNASLFGQMGLARLYGGDLQRIDAVFDLVGRGPFKDPGVTIKAYPCCTATHTAMEACEKIRARLEETGTPPQAISSIIVRVSKNIPMILIHDKPATALEGKFSMQFCVAVALCLSSLGLSAFTDEQLINPSIRHVMERVEMVATEEDVDLLYCSVEVHMTDGSSFSEVVERPKGSPDRPFERGDLERKFISLCPGLNAPAALEHLFQLPKADSWQSFEQHLSSLLHTVN